MKRLILPIGLILLVCVAGTIYLGLQRPFAPETHAASTTPALVVAQATAAPTFTSAPSPATLPPPDTLTDTATATPTATASPTITPFQETTAAPPASDPNLTQTAVPAEQTLDAIDARAKATWTPTPGPSPTPRAIDQTTNILLMGTDTRPTDPNWVPSTDVMMVLSIDQANQRAALISFPRDLVVAIPHHFGFRINYVYQYGLKQGPSGGADLVKQTLQEEFGIRIDHWALIDFNGFQKIIDTLGGVDVHVPCALEDTIDNQHFVIPAGNVHMDYLTAKRYVQSRYTTSDTSRNFRQQRILWAILKKGMQLGALDKLPTLWDQLHDSVQTDMSLFEMASLVPDAYTIDPVNHPERIHARVLEYPAVYPYVASDGAWLFMPNYTEINERLDHLFDAPPLATRNADAAECPGGIPTLAPTLTPTPAG